jgi:hypothetical protein
MAGPFQFLDLSALTTSLVDALDAAITNDPMWTGPNPKPPVSVSGSAPDSVRDGEGGVKVTLYLFHVETDPHNRNSPLLGKRAAELPFQPMSLHLYYLLTAFAKENYVQEQQMMSIALRWFYEHPVFSTVAGANSFTMTMQPESSDELGRLWQSMVTSARLATVYRVAVVFMTAPEPVAPLAKPVESFELYADPAELPFAQNGAVMGTDRRVTYRVPDQPEPHIFRQSPASAAPGQRFVLWGSHLGSAPSDRIYLLSADGATETDVTSWVVPAADPPGGSRRTLALPATTGALPANAPPPGVYQLRVGADAPHAYRANATPVLVGPSITPPANPNVFLTPAGGVFSLTGINFVAATTDVYLGTVALNRINPGDPLDSGTFLADTPTTIQFRLPATIPAGDYPVRVRVNQVEADPAWWVHG